MFPHSCGQSCGKRRTQTCPHPCTSICHPGPCPPCTAMGPVQKCFCGAQTRQIRCLNTDYILGSFSCLKPCGRMLECRQHRCTEICHSGICMECPVLVSCSCICGKEITNMSCHEMHSGLSSGALTNLRCQNTCGELLTCGKHRCSAVCHKHDSLRHGQCMYSPELVQTCHCGSARLDDLGAKRTSCSDVIPSCGQKCRKALSCGHTCPAVCHAGSCPDCNFEQLQQCRCETTQISISCSEIAQGISPLCQRICRSELSCSRHICKNVCCQGLPKAQKRRQARLKGSKARSKSSHHTDDEAEHICSELCGRPLNCGKHFCQSSCHPGRCSSCLEASFDDLVCACGATVIQAPVLCGTTLPQCEAPCQRTPECGHPPVSHTCHPVATSCPRCPYLVTKTCRCGKMEMANQPCWQAAVSCGRRCDKILNCGKHHCNSTCHDEGYCEEPCGQICGKPLQECGHACQALCHQGVCLQDPLHVCQFPVTVSCECGIMQEQMMCGAGSTEYSALRTPLPCSDNCLAEKRRTELSNAFNLPQSSADATTTETPGTLLDFYSKNRIWCSGIEAEFGEFLAAERTAKMFRPMRYALRAFIHELAQEWCFYSESFDDEPNRSVQLTKTARSAKPKHTLCQSALLAAQEAKEGKSYTSVVNNYNALISLGPASESLKAALDEFFLSQDPDSILGWQTTFADAYVLINPTRLTLQLGSSNSAGASDNVGPSCIDLKASLNGVLKIVPCFELCIVDQFGIVRCETSASTKKLKRMHKAVSSNFQSKDQAIHVQNSFANLSVLS